MQEYPKISELLASFEESGRISFTQKEIRELGYPPKALQVALWRLQSQGKIVSPARGFFVKVGIPYRKVGSPPPTWYVDSWMAFKNVPYYVGLLSAASFHGATHHAIMETEVMVPRPFPITSVGSARFRFFVKAHIEQTPRIRRETPTGTIEVSSPAGTLFDLVTYAKRIGGINAVATIAAELGDNISLKDLRSCLDSMPMASADLQRLGFLLEKLSFPKLAIAVAEELKNKTLHTVPLSCTNPSLAGERNSKWNVIENEIIEVDV
jgi:predicted transcriptional regulator of viral defense system